MENPYCSCKLSAPLAAHAIGDAAACSCNPYGESLWIIPMENPYGEPLLQL